jgi:hypothetical protein
MKTIEATLNQWAETLGIEPRTLGRRLTRAEIKVEPRQKLTAKQIFTALMGDKEAAQAREANARAEKLERENAEATDSLCKMEDVQKVMRETLLPVRQRLMALPSEAAHLCNPTDPQFAQQALQGWVDRSLPLIRDGINKGD